MRIKEIIGLIAILLMTLFSCDPMHDIDKALDAKEEADKNGGNSTVQKALTYELVAADYTTLSKAALAAATNAQDSAYAKAVASQGAFNQWIKPQPYMPALMKSLYPGLGNGSSVMVTLNMVTVAPELVQNLNGMVTYKLTDADYPNAQYDWFTPDQPAANYLAAVLKENIAEPATNQFVLASYNYSGAEPDIKEVRSPFFSENFDESGYADKDNVDKNGWTQYFAKGDKFKWQTRSNNDGLGAQFSSFKSGEDNETWLISPEIDLAGISDAQMTFGVKYNYQVAGHKPLAVKISVNYTGGDVAAAEWTDITSRFSYADESNNPYSSAGDASLEDFAGKKIRAAFVYTGSSISSPAMTTTVLIDDIEFSTVQTTVIPQADVIGEYAVYQYNGSVWKAFTSGRLSDEATSNTPVYALQPADYDEMGTSGPGKNNNFSSSLLPNNYIPQFLAQKNPYAQIGDQQVVVYQFYSNKVVTNEAALYTLDSMRVWQPQSTLTKVTEQYLNIGSKWVFDPTITFTMLEADYQAIVNWVEVNKGEKWLDQRYLAKKNAEMWCGASAYYKNIDFTIALRRGESADPDGTLVGLNDDEAYALFQERIKNDGLPAVLKARYPDAPAITSGVTQYYQVIYLVYPERAYYMVKYEGLGNGEFKYVEGPIKQ